MNGHGGLPNWVSRETPNLPIDGMPFLMMK